jgi:hypothetical protein
MRKKKLEAILILEIKINLIKNKIKTIKKRGYIRLFLGHKKTYLGKKKINERDVI